MTEVSSQITEFEDVGLSNLNSIVEVREPAGTCGDVITRLLEIKLRGVMPIICIVFFYNLFFIL